MIDVQRQVQDMIKIAEETNIIIIEMEEIILKASINNWTMNATKILGILEDLQYLIQCNMEDRAYQVQRVLADKLDAYREWGNKYMDDNIQEIQKLYKDVEQRRESNEERVEVILIKLYKVSKLASSITKSSFIEDKADNLIKYMKFIWLPTQTRLFKPPPYYQSLQSRREQDPNFWKKVVTVLVDNKHNTKTL